MNYSDYFENKVAATLSQEFNLIILKTDPNTYSDFISETKLFPTMSDVYSYLDALDPYAIIMSDKVITAKVMNYVKEKVQ
jgi:hypothetical protein